MFFGHKIITSGSLTFLLLPFITNSKAMEEISCTYSDYQSKTFLNDRTFDTSPKNFERHLSFFAACLIHIINFDGIDITRNHLESKYTPCILTRLDIVHVYFDDPKDNFRSFMLPFEKVPKPKTVNDRKMTYQDWEWTVMN